MMPATFPSLPASVFPGLLLPAPLAGASVIDVTAAVAAIVWAVGGLIALRIALAMSRESDRSSPTNARTTPTRPHGLRDAA